MNTKVNPEYQLVSSAWLPCSNHHEHQQKNPLRGSHPKCSSHYLLTTEGKCSHNDVIYLRTSLSPSHPFQVSSRSDASLKLDIHFWQMTTVRCFTVVSQGV